MNKKILVILTVIIVKLLIIGLIMNVFHKTDIEFTFGNENKITTPTSSATHAPTPSPTLSIVSLQRDIYTIALYGDSMIDTMGEKLEILEKELYASYPKTTFKLYNYGIGAQNIEDGVSRFEKSFSNKERLYPPIRNISPDIIILGSFAYNPFAPHDLERYKKELIELIQKSKNATSQVYLLIEIAPKKTGFGKGEFGVNWTEDQAYQQVLIIIDQIKAAINTADAEGIPVINAFSESLQNDGFGNPAYVRKEDGIHPSYQGHLLMAREIVSRVLFK